jgi:formylglycine-generating enzyme
MMHRRAVLAGSAGLLASGRLAAQPAASDNFAGAQAGAARSIGGIAFCWCPAGNFLMGSPDNEPGRRANENQVAVTLTRGFWMGKYEVTQGEWKRVFGAPPGPLIGGAGDNFPAYFISYARSEEFCRVLTRMSRAADSLPAGWRFAIPTEAQWEYACRAGTRTAFAFGDRLTPAQANIGKPYKGRADGTPGSAATEVGAYPPNAWGLHDMHGNEFEWCKDWYHARLPGGVDPDLSQLRGAPNRNGSYSRARRGGAWTDSADWCRSAIRLPYEPERDADHIGLRLAVVMV